MEIGSKLKQARKEKGVTQEQSAELLGVSRQTISNWENNKSYPDIVSVIKMSDLYSVSLDHLLKEEKSMKQTYQEFLEESTNTVKAKRNLGRILLLSTYVIVWVIAMLVLWNTKGPMTSGLAIAFRWVLLPLLLLISTIILTRNDDLGKGNWFCVGGGAVSFLVVPYTEYVEIMGTVSYTFRFPNFGYMVVGVLISLCGIGLGTLWKRKSNSNKI